MMIRIEESRHYLSNTLFMRESYSFECSLFNAWPTTAVELVPPERRREYFSPYCIARIAMCTSRSCATRWTGRSFRSAESRMLARSTRFRHRGSWLPRPTSCWLAVGPEETSQNLPSGNNRCTGAIQSLPASFGSVH